MYNTSSFHWSITYLTKLLLLLVVCFSYHIAICAGFNFHGMNSISESPKVTKSLSVTLGYPQPQSLQGVPALEQPSPLATVSSKVHSDTCCVLVFSTAPDALRYSGMALSPDMTTARCTCCCTDFSMATDALRCTYYSMDLSMATDTL